MENGVYDKTCVWCLSIIIYSNMTENAGTNKRCPLRESWLYFILSLHVLLRLHILSFHVLSLHVLSFYVLLLHVYHSMFYHSSPCFTTPVHSIFYHMPTAYGTLNEFVVIQ